MMKNREQGIAGFILIITIVVLVLIGGGIYYFLKSGDIDYLNKNIIKNNIYMNESDEMSVTPTISDSADDDTLEAEIESTQIELESLEDDLSDLESDLNSL